MQNILNRNLINPDIGFVEFGQAKPKDRDYIFSRINKIKQLLVKNGIQRGDFVHVYVMSPNVDAVSSFIAIAELGCLTHCVDNAVWHDKDEEGNETGRMYFEDRKQALYDMVHPSMPPERPEFRLSDMLTPIGDKGLVKGDLFAGAGNKFHYARGVADKDVCFIDFRDIGNMPDEDIQPWDVSDDDPFYIVGYGHGHVNYNVTQKQVVEKAKDCIDIFGFEGRKVAMTKAMSHFFGFENAILPCLMSARKFFELPVMQQSRVVTNQKVGEREMSARDISLNLIARHGCELVWGIDEGDIENVENHEGFENINIIRHEGNDYDDFEKRPTCLNRVK